MPDRDAASAALVRVWHVYRLINVGIAEGDARYTALERFLRDLREAGVTDEEMLAVEGLKFLKRMDQPGRGALE